MSPAGGRRYAIFGESDWDHIEVQAGFVVEGTTAGIVSAVPAGSAVIGWAADVEREGSDWFLALRRRASVSAAWQLVTRELLPALPDDRPTTLHLTLFDDRLRATVGETQVEAPRGAHRHGRLALLAEGVTRITGLLVRGLPMFQFPVQVSRFVDFDEHIGSFSGELDEIEPSAMGDAPSQTVAGLLSQTSGDISRLMSREADPAERQELFDRWTAGLGVPFRQTLEGLSLSSYRPDGSVRALVLESPEPLRFTHEVALAAERWYRDRRPRSPFDDILVARAADDSLDLELRLAERTASRRFRFARVEEGDRGERHYRVYEGSTTWRADRIRFRSDHSYAVEGSSNRGRSLGTALSDVPPGVVAILDRVRDVVVGLFDPGRIVTVPVRFVILTDAAQQNALLIPTDAGAAVALATGNYRLEFSIDRERWQSLDGGSADQRLSESAVLNFRL
ncbi:MAG: hypothetical protein V3T28_08775 [Gemmatimonadales bacterium]